MSKPGEESKAADVLFKSLRGRQVSASWGFQVFIMWLQMKEKEPFRVVEMGAGHLLGQRISKKVPEKIVFSTPTTATTTTCRC